MNGVERLHELLMGDDLYEEELLRNPHNRNVWPHALDEKGERKPFYGYEYTPSIDSLVNQAIKNINMKSPIKPMEYLVDKNALKESRENVYPKNLLLYEPDRENNRFVIEDYKRGKSIPPKDSMMLCSDKSNAAVDVSQDNNSRSGTQKQQEPITRFDDGVGAAIKQTGLSWKYLFKNAQKMFTTDEEKQKEIQKEIDQIGEEYRAMPPMRGMAQIGAIGTNVVGVALPTVIAGALLSPPAAAAVGGALTTLDMAGTASQANMEIDSYERETGNKVSENDRAAYTAASVATDAIMNVLIGAKVLKNATPGMRETLSRELKESLLKNPVAQQEFNTMTRQVLNNEMKNLPNEMAESMVKSGVEAGVASGAMEGEKSIYTGEAPELERIVNSVIGGFASGMAQGAVGGALAPKQRHNERMAKDDVYYVSVMNDEKKESLPISEIEPKAVHTEGKRTYVKGVVSPSTGGGSIKDDFDARNISGGSYKEAHRQGATTDKSDAWNIEESRMNDYEKVWNDATNGRSDEEYYAMRNEVVQGLAADMGVPVTVYRSYKDLPKELKAEKNIGENGAVTVNHDGIYVVLDNCEDITASNLAAVIRHEAVGHFGMRKLYANDKAYEADIEKIGRAAYGDKKDYEEELSLKAELRNDYQNHSDNANLERVYELLRKSEENLRNSTVTELRNLPGKRYLDYKFSDGIPMPSLYDIEQSRKGMRER